MKLNKIFRVYIVYHVIVVFLIYLGNNMLGTSFVEIKNAKIPSSFDGYTIVQISDLHNKKFGKNQSKLINKIKEVLPDIIVITGDIIYKRIDDITNCIDFLKEAVKISPVYFVNGNHECQAENPKIIRKVLKDFGVIILENNSFELRRDKDSIMIWGTDDPTNYSKMNENVSFKDIMHAFLSKMKVDASKFNILLTHRPDYLDLYNKFKFDLVFCGHVHGGQIRLPFFGGLFGPGLRFFPKYSAGVYEKGSTSEVVSRGLGGSIINVRILNNPEIVVCKLKSEQNG